MLRDSHIDTAIGGHEQKQSIMGVGIIALLTPAPIIDPLPAKGALISTNQSAVSRWIWTNERSLLCLTAVFPRGLLGDLGELQPAGLAVYPEPAGLVSREGVEAGVVPGPGHQVERRPVVRLVHSGSEIDNLSLMS